MTSRIVLYGLFSLVAAAQSPTQSKVIVNDPDDRLSTVPTNFLHGATDNSYNQAKTTVATQNFLTRGELLREQIAAGLASCGLGQ
jgi:hypothetical protein